MKRVLLYILGGAIACAGITYGAIVLTHGPSYVAASPQKQLMIQGPAATAPATKDKKPVPVTQVTLTYDKYGFEPNQFKVPVGTTIVVKNVSSQTLNFQALPNNPTVLRGLNVGTIDPGQSSKFSVDQTGSWQFQANGNPAIRGDIAGFDPNGIQWSGLSEDELPQYNPKAKSILINYTDYGFVPNIISVPIGTRVTVRNSTDEGGMDFEELSRVIPLLIPC